MLLLKKENSAEHDGTRRGTIQVLLMLASQGLVLAASLLPAVTGDFQQLRYSVFCAAIAGALVNFGLLGMSTRFLACEAKDTSLVFWSSMCFSMGIFGLGGIAALLCLLGAPSLAGYVLGSSLLFITNCLYTAIFVTKTREGDFTAHARIRVSYSVFFMAGSLIATLLLDYTAGVAVAQAISLVLAVSFDWTIKIYNVSMPVLAASVSSAYVKKSLSTSLSFLANDLAGAVPASAIPKMGVYADVFATALKLLGGFILTGVQIISPRIESALAVARRGKNRSKAMNTTHTSLVLLPALGAICVLASLIAAYLIAPQPAENVPVFWGAVCVVLISVFIVGILSKAWLILGTPRLYGVWAMLRLMLGLSALALLSGLPLIVALAAIQLVMTCCFMSATRHYASKV